MEGDLLTSFTLGAKLERSADLLHEAMRVELVVEIDEAQEWPHRGKHTLANVIARKFVRLKNDDTETLAGQAAGCVGATRTSADDENLSFRRLQEDICWTSLS